MKKIKQEIHIAPSDPQLTLDYIAELWVKWNIKEITGDDFAERIGQLLKTKTAKAWDKYCHSQSNDPLEKLFV